jgi:Tol biopolymer transport system component
LRAEFLKGVIEMSKRVLLLTVVTIAVMTLAAAPLAYAGTTERVSVDSNGVQGNGGSSDWSEINADGRFVAFQSYANNLVPDDTNGETDIFVRDRLAGTTEMVSINSEGIQGNSYSYSPSMSADGRFVVFQSGANNLVPNYPRPINNLWDLFLHDRLTGTTEQVSLTDDDKQPFGHNYRPSMSADGRYVAFYSSATNMLPNTTDANGSNMDVFVRDRLTGTTEMVSVSSSGEQGNSASYDPAISGDGRFVAFISRSSNLVPGDINGKEDAFVHDRQTGETYMVSVDSNGIQANAFSMLPAINSDGRCVAFQSTSTNLVPGDTNGRMDVFVRDMEAGITERVSVTSSGGEGDGHSGETSLSGDCRFVSFTSSSTNLIPGGSKGSYNNDVFVRDRLLGRTELVGVNDNGVQGNNGSFRGTLNADGRFISFASSSTNLVHGDTNGRPDIFVRDRGISVEGVIAMLQELLAAGDIANKGTAASLTATLDSALRAQQNGNNHAARNTLLAFINKVQAQSGKNISEDSAAALIEAANEVLATLE